MFSNPRFVEKCLLQDLHWYFWMFPESFFLMPFFFVLSDMQYGQVSVSTGLKTIFGLSSSTMLRENQTA